MKKVNEKSFEIVEKKVNLWYNYSLIMAFKKISFLLIFVLFAHANSAGALSFGSFLAETLGFGKTSSTTQTDNKEENIQTLKVFESDSSFNEIALQNNIPKEILDNKDVTFENGRDNFLEGEDIDSHSHSDNAIYRVQKNDSIYSIASYLGVSVDTIMSFNKKTSITVRVGETLEVPSVPGILHEVKKGDTLKNLAKKYEIEVDDITLFNGLLENENLAIGDEIYLPGAKEKEVVQKDSNKKTTAKSTKVNSSLAKYIPKNWARGDTSHLNTLSSINKYSSLPKFAGYYTHPAPGTIRTQKMHGHNSVDFAGKIGTAILAAAEGRVRVAKNSGYNFGYGNYIIITHPNGTETVYAHMSSVSVAVGQNVSKGERIGALGSSGNSTGPHLHFEIRGGYNPWAW